MTHRRNSRNEVINLRRLLKGACRLLDMYGTEMDRELADWWKARKVLDTKDREARSEKGLIAEMATETD